MALVIEDGTGVVGANSYATLDQVKDYMTDRALTTTCDDVALTQKIIVAMDYIEALEDSFLGCRTDAVQALSWPRKDVYVGDESITLENTQNVPSNTISQHLINALCQLTFDASNTALTPVTDGKALIEDTTGPLTFKYASPTDGGSSGQTSKFRKFESLIKLLQKASFTRFTSVRI